MGISINLVPTLLDVVRAHGLSGPLLMLGRQDVEVSESGLADIFRSEAFSPMLDRQRWRIEKDRVSPESFFEALGFPLVESLDVSGMEGAQIVFDLNATSTPSHLQRRYRVLFDGGTLEHVFHLPNALARCADMLEDDGAFIHIGPMNNYVDHGFYQFSPTFWFDWFAANGWKMAESVAVRLPSSHRPDGTGWSYRFLPPGRFGAVGQMDDAPYMHFLVAIKPTGATADKIPMQSFYAQKYGQSYRDASGLMDFHPYIVVDGRRQFVDAVVSGKALSPASGLV